MAGQINAGSAFVELSLRNKLTDGLVRAKTMLQNFGAAVTKVGLVFGGLSAAVVAPLGAAVASLVGSGKIDQTLVLFKQLNDTIQSIAEELALAVSPVLDKTLGVVNGLALAASKWLKDHKALAVVIAKFATGLGVVGAAAVGIGAAFSFAGTALGAMATTVAAISAFLATPLGIAIAIGAAIAAGVSGWLLFTSSGQAAAKSLMETFGPAIVFVKTLVSGIADALAAGNLALAGKIALAGLQIVFLQGVSAITSAMDTMFGDFFGSVATDIIKGDFKSAWDTTLIGMGAAWDALAAGLVAAFKFAIDQITKLWLSLHHMVNATLINLHLPALGSAGAGITNVLQGAGSVAGAIRNVLGSAAVESAVRTRTRTAGGTGALEKDLAEKQAELIRLAAQAAKERAAMPNAPAIEKLRAITSVATTSAGGALALAASGGGGLQGRMLKATEKTAGGVMILGMKLDTLTERIEALKARAS